MAREIITRLVDDVDGSTATATVKFAFEGTHYEIDLSEDNRAKMRKGLEPFIRAGRRTGGKQLPKDGAGQTKTQVIRAWAEQQGLEVPPRGRVPNAIVEQYEAAQA